MPVESVQVYDPQFTHTEIQLLTKLNFHVININEVWDPSKKYFESLFQDQIVL